MIYDYMIYGYTNPTTIGIQSDHSIDLKMKMKVNELSRLNQLRGQS